VAGGSCPGERPFREQARGIALRPATRPIGVFRPALPFVALLTGQRDRLRARPVASDGLLLRVRPRRQRRLVGRAQPRLGPAGPHGAVPGLTLYVADAVEVARAVRWMPPAGPTAVALASELGAVGAKHGKRRRSGGWP